MDLDRINATCAATPRVFIDTYEQLEKAGLVKAWETFINDAEVDFADGAETPQEIFE